MKTIAILALALLATACQTTGYQEPVNVTGNGTEACPHKDCLDRQNKSDPR